MRSHETIVAAINSYFATMTHNAALHGHILCRKKKGGGGGAKKSAPQRRTCLYNLNFLSAESVTI